MDCEGTRRVARAGSMTRSLRAAAGYAARVTVLTFAALTGALAATSTVGGYPPGADPPLSYAEGFRFLTQATFGPRESDVRHLQSVGPQRWLDEQAAMKPTSARAEVEAVAAEEGRAGLGAVINGLWKQYLTSDAQLRWRVAHAWSQIFVISLVDGGVHSEPRAAAAYMDMLAEKGLGNYRDLLQAVALHPMMGQYLSHRGNQKADPSTGRVPDENFAREVMQLFSIGLYELNPDGSLRLDGKGQPIETYTQADIVGLARVFTGFSWSCPTFPSEKCFLARSPRFIGDTDSGFKPMMGYPQFHSTEEKRFLGVTIAPQKEADPQASLKVALDTLFNHPNVGPFIGRQMIQRLVSSNPSPAYVKAVADAFADNGHGVRGDLRAVVEAVLLNPEARNPRPDGGKVREPILRLTAFMRAFPMRSQSGRFAVGNPEDPGTQLGQSPLRSPSVFNFYRPGFVPPGSDIAKKGLVAPEMQLVSESSVAGYVNYMRYNIERGGVGGSGAGPTRDVQLDFSAELSKAQDVPALVQDLNERLFGGSMTPALHDLVVEAVSSVPLPASSNDGNSRGSRDAALKRRVDAAILLSVASTEFLVER